MEVPRSEVPAPGQALARRLWFLPVFAAYVGIVCFAAARHEPWFDEVQAWLIARDATLPDLILTIPRYEGSPIGWHVVLAIPARCGLPFVSEKVIAAVFASLAMLLFLARSPLPKFLAAMVPFTFFMLYQHAVVARSYGLMPLALFVAAAFYPIRFRRPWLYVLVLWLLSEICSHALLIAVALAGVLVVEALWGLVRDRDTAAFRRVAIPVGLLAFMAALTVWQISCPSDHFRGPGYQKNILEGIRFAVERWNGSLTDAYIPSAIVLILSVAWFWQTGALAVYAAATAAVMAVMVLGSCWYHHEGIFFFVWLFAIWISFQNARSGALPPGRWTAWLRRCFVAAAAGVFALQIYWAGASIRADALYDYSGAKALAGYLKREGLDSKRIVTADIYALAAVPYLEKNAFANFRNGRGSSFVVWAERYFQRPEDFFRLPLAFRQPFDVLVMSVKHPPFCDLPWENPEFEFPLSDDFRRVGYFPGNLFWKTGVYERDDFVCYVRKGIPAAAYALPSRDAARRDLRVLNFEYIDYINAVFGGGRKQDPEAQAHALFGRMLQKVDPASAVRHFRKALEIEPDGDTWCALGETLAATDLAEARRCLEAALALKPVNGDTYDVLGGIYVRAGQYDAAIQCYQAALSQAYRAAIFTWYLRARYPETWVDAVSGRLAAAIRLKLASGERAENGKRPERTDQ